MPTADGLTATWNAPVELKAGTVTVAGTVAIDVLLLASETVAPPVGVWAVNANVAEVPVVPVWTVEGLNVIDASAPPGTLCYITGNGVPGGAIGAADVDGGATTLTSPLINMNAGWTYFTAGMMTEACEQVEKMLETEPEFYGAYWLKGAIYLTEGKYEAAIDELKKGVEHGGHQTVLADLGSAYGLAGRKEEAEGVLNELLEMREKDYVSAICLARVYARLGDDDKAIEWMEKAFDERNGEMLFFKGEMEESAENDPLRSLVRDPRVNAIFERMNLP